MSVEIKLSIGVSLNRSRVNECKNTLCVVVMMVTVGEIPAQSAIDTIYH